VTASLPSGTVTLLFTDIEGSTKLLSRVGDQAYGALLEEERTLVAAAVEEAGGVVFGSEGDAHFAAFASAPAGVRGAVAAQRAITGHAWPGGERVRVRMGLHTGEVQVSNGDYHGFEVHRAARVAAVAHGGQVLVSGPTRALAETGGELGFRDLGEHRLKDIERPERLFQVEAPGLATDFPPPRSLNAAPPGNLPTQLTSFVGRAEMAAATELLGRTRLLTLTGPGGTGKTRLSIALATASRDRFPDGAWFVPLAPISDPDLIGSAIAGAFGLLATDRQPLDVVRDHLVDRTTLLVLDNFEQLVEGASIVADLLRAAPRLTVIVSSRAPLRIAGEQEFAVPPLGLPPSNGAPASEIGDAEAVRLFVERATAVRPDFALTADNAHDVAEIVRRLDGLPLAIELAAARIRLLAPAAMARRLDDRLALLAGGGRDLPERQRTLRGAIEWSHDLLDPDQRRLFARLSAFARGGPLDLVETVCTIPAETIPPVDGTLEQLAEQSLVRIADDVHGDVRFAMLETIHEYASERLAASGEAPTIQDRHADAVIALAQSAPQDADRGEWLDRMDDEHDNIRTAFEHLVAAGDVERASTLVFACWRFWHMRGHVLEGRRRVDRVLAMPGFAPEGSVLRLRTLEAAGGLAYWGGELSEAGAYYADAEDEARRLGDDAEIANALYNRFFAREGIDDPTSWREAMTTEARLLEEAIRIWQRLGDEYGVARGLWGLGEYHTYRGEYAEAEEALSAALAIFERRGDQFWIAWTVFTRTVALSEMGDVVAAAADLATALRAFRAAGDVSGLALGMTAVGSVLLLSGRTADAYRVKGAADRLIAETGVRLAQLGVTREVPAPDASTSDPELVDALEVGRGWERSEAVDHAVALADAIARGEIGVPPPKGSFSGIKPEP
jgi:predicted ATPase/class 3 adenylate cyclase